MLVRESGVFLLIRSVFFLEKQGGFKKIGAVREFGGFSTLTFSL